MIKLNYIMSSLASPKYFLLIFAFYNKWHHTQGVALFTWVQYHFCCKLYFLANQKVWLPLWNQTKKKTRGPKALNQTHPESIIRNLAMYFATVTLPKLTLGLRSLSSIGKIGRLSVNSRSTFRLIWAGFLIGRRFFVEAIKLKVLLTDPPIFRCFVIGYGSMEFVSTANV